MIWTQPDQIQPQGVGNDAKARKAHCRRAEHGVELPAEKRYENACRQRNTYYIIDKSPKQILTDISQRRLSQSDSSRNVAEAAVDEHNIGGVDRDVGSRSYSDADISSRQGRRVVDSVADHRGLVFFAQLANDALLAVGQDARDHIVYASLCADRLGGFLVVARKHHNAQAELLQLSYGCGTVLL